MVHRSTVGSLLLFCSVVVFLPREQLLLLVVLLLLVEGNGTSLGRLLKTILSLCSGTFSRLGAVFVYSWVHVAAIHDHGKRGILVSSWLPVPSICDSRELLFLAVSARGGRGGGLSRRQRLMLRPRSDRVRRPR